jgi:hypothetical protein
LFLSGTEDEDLARQAINQGIPDYLVKEAFDGKQFTRSLRYSIERQAAAGPRHEPDRARHSNPGRIGTSENNSGSEQGRRVESCATARKRKNHGLSKAETL